MKYLVIVLALAAMAACTTVPESRPTDQSWNERQQQLSRIAYWSMRGRLAVNNGVEAWNLNVSWRQRDGDYQIELHGPFGAGKVLLKGNPQGVVLRNSDDQTYYATEPETLLYAQTGVTMPVDGLRYWILGLPQPGADSKPQLDEHGRVKQLHQAAWEVDFRHYVTVNGVELPRKIFITKPGKDIDVRLVVDQWQLGVL
jgi:outer membrane lipoprotein LolB